MLHTMTIEEKLIELERLIQQEIRMTGKRNPALAAVCADLRGRIDSAPSAAMVDIERRIVALARTKTKTGYDPHALHFVGEGVAVHWPTVKQALERFGAEIEQGGDAMIIHNVRDGRRGGWVGSWVVEPLPVLEPVHVGATVIYRDHGRAEAGTITSWRDGVVFARYSCGDTAAGAGAADLVLGIRALDTPEAIADARREGA